MSRGANRASQGDILEIGGGREKGEWRRLGAV